MMSGILSPEDTHSESYGGLPDLSSIVGHDRAEFPHR